MKLLMITRRIDKESGLTGFTYNWVKKLAAHLDKLYVICLEKGNTQGLPDNIEIYSLGKERGKNRWKEFWRFQSLAKKLVPKVDGVFAHQNPEYGILIAPWTKIFHKKLIAWYTHKSITWRLRLLNSLANKMLTASPASFRLPSKKLKVLHHGIDTDLFSFKEKRSHEQFRLLSVSRISETKNIHLMIELVKKLKTKLNKEIKLEILGEPTLKIDKLYLQQLKDKVTEWQLENEVEFLGSVANHQTPRFYQAADVFLNFSKTGSLDKTVLEAMSCGTLVLVTNEALKDTLNNFDSHLYSDSTDIDKLAAKLENVLNLGNGLSRKLSDYVKNNHSLTILSAKIVKLFTK